MTVVGGDDDESYAILEWLIEYMAVPAEQIVFVSHFSAYPSLGEERFQKHFISELTDEEENTERQRMYGGVIRLRYLSEYHTNHYTDDLQYKPVRSTVLAIIVFQGGANTFDRVTSLNPIPNLDDDSPATQEQYKKWEAEMEGRFLLAGAHDADARMDLMLVQNELASLGVTTTTVMDSGNDIKQKAWIETFLKCHSSCWKPVPTEK